MGQFDSTVWRATLIGNMAEANFNQYLAKKAYEISYALFRVAAVLKRRALADHLENQALLLLTHTIGEEYMKSSVTAVSIEYLVKFGEDLGIINGENGRLVSAELRAFHSAIVEFEKSAKIEAADLQSIFSKPQLPVGVTAELHTSESAIRSSGAENIERGTRETTRDARGVGSENGNGNGNGNNVVKAAMRQAAILERIRQNNDSRLRDIQEWLTDVSERTIRYDLQNLIGQGLVERLGSGGPATFYRTRG